MKHRRSARKKRARPESDLVQALKRLLQQIVPDYVQRLASAEHRAERSEEELTVLRGKLAGLLSKDQLDAATVCGVTPEMYAIECIEIWKEKIFPSFPAEIRPLSELKGNYYDRN